MSYNKELHKLKYIKERFEAKFIPEPNSGCWLWEATTNPDGYGRFRYKGTLTGAHRVSLMLYKEQENKNLCVLHRCDTPCCVNPEHLYFGTHSENMKDRQSKGRGKFPGHKGDTHYRSQLTSEDVQVIKKEISKGVSDSVLGMLYGISAGAIGNIRRGKNWKHI